MVPQRCFRQSSASIVSWYRKNGNILSFHHCRFIQYHSSTVNPNPLSCVRACECDHSEKKWRNVNANFESNDTKQRDHEYRCATKEKKRYLFTDGTGHIAREEITEEFSSRSTTTKKTDTRATSCTGMGSRVWPHDGWGSHCGLFLDVPSREGTNGTRS